MSLASAPWRRSPVIRLALLAACLVVWPQAASGETRAPAHLPSWRRDSREATGLPALATGTYAQRYGLYSYRRNWYSMPYRYRSYYYRPWYTLPPSYFVVPKNYSPYAPPTWSLPGPYGDYPSQDPFPLDGWEAAPPAVVFEPIAPPRASGRYYW